MFCNRCGSELQPDSIACPHCRRRIGDPIGAVAHSRLQGHLHILATLWMFVGGLFLFPAAGLMVFGSGIHFAFHHREPFARFLPFFCIWPAAVF